MDDVLFRCPAFVAFACGGGSVLVYLVSQQRGITLPRSTVALMEFCRRFRTLEEHAQAAVNTFLSGSYEEGLFTLRDLAARRILTPLASLHSAGHDGTGTPGPTSMAVPIGESLRMSRRCLQSYATKCRHPVDRLLLLSANPAQSSECREVLRESCANLALAGLSYVTQRDARRFTQELCATCGIPLRVGHLALSGNGSSEWTGGVVRNCLLLLTSGTRCVMVEPETLGLSKRLPNPNSGSGIVLGGHQLPTQTSFGRRARELLGSTVDADIDAIGEHLRFLGRSPSDIVALEQGSVDVVGLCSHLCHSLETATGTILLTAPGLAGPAEGVLSERFWEDDPAYMQPLTNFDARFLQGRCCRWAIRHASETTLGHIDSVQFGSIGIDNRVLVPPFVPARGVDAGTFVRLLRMIHSDVYIAHLPWAAILRKRLAVVESGTALSFQSPRYALHAHLDRAPQVFGYHSPEVRIRSIAEYLMLLGQMKPKDFCELHRCTAWSIASERIGSLEGLLDRYGDTSPRWTGAILAEIKRVSEMMKGTCDDHFGADLQHFPAYLPGWAAQAQKTLFEYGELLYWWPTLVRAAQQNDFLRDIGTGSV